MALAQVSENIRKLVENDAYAVLLHPKVLSNYLLYSREQETRPLVMRSVPPFVEIELTNRCNLACIQCLRSVGLKPYKLGDMDFENYQRILAQFPYAVNVSLNGFGEPMMYARFFDVVEYTRKQIPWVKIGIYTNGGLIDDAKAERMPDSGLTEVNVSLDAATPDVYRRVRRGGRLEVVHENIRRMVRARARVRAKFPLLGINYVMVNDNEGELVPFIEQAADLGVDFINCITWAAYDWGFRNKRTPDSYLRELEAGRKRIDELGVRCKSFPEMNTRWADPKKPFFCGFYWGEEFRVTYDGHITLGCCTPFKETYAYGNLLEQPLADIWNGEAIQRNRQLALQNRPPTPTCASCDAFCKNFFTPPEERGTAVIPVNSLAVAPPGR